MHYRKLGSSNLQVSTLCLGSMMFGDPTPKVDAAAMVADAHSHGVNCIDTADVYSKGLSETLIGEVLKGQRHHWILATKLGNKMSERVNESQFSRSWMMREIDASLQRLQTDYVDILYLHLDINGMNLEEPLRAMQAMLQAGKIRYWGVSNFRGWRISEAVHLARQINMPPPVVCQPYYNLLNRMPEVEVLPACAFYGLGVMPYSPIARGVLSGKYTPGQAPAVDSRAGRGNKRLAETELRQESLLIAQKLQAYVAGKTDSGGLTLAQFATAWVLANPRVSSVIAGPRTLQQWQDYLPALNYTLTADDEAMVDSLVRPGHPSTPGFTDPAYPLSGR